MSARASSRSFSTSARVGTRGSDQSKDIARAALNPRKALKSVPLVEIVGLCVIVLKKERLPRTDAWPLFFYQSHAISVGVKALQ